MKRSNTPGLLGVLSVVTTIVLASCGKAPEKQESQTKSVPGVTLLVPGSVYNVSFTDRNGRVHSRQVSVGANWGGDYACMGQCGRGCTGSTVYTWDCLVHDVCSAAFASQGGLRDPNCGDEFRHAVNDYRHVHAAIP